MDPLEYGHALEVDHERKSWITYHWNTGLTLFSVGQS